MHAVPLDTISLALVRRCVATNFSNLDRPDRQNAAVQTAPQLVAVWFSNGLNRHHVWCGMVSRIPIIEAALHGQ